MSIEIDMTYQGDLHCQAMHGPSRSTLITDAPVDNGGRGDAFSPTDLLAVALGTCMLTVMGLVAKRAGLDISGTRARVAKEMAAAPVRRIGLLRLIVTVPHASRLSEADRAKLERAADACPVKQSLHPDVNIATEFVYED